MGIEFVDAGSVRDATWPDTDDGDYARRVLVPMISDGASAYVANVHTEQQAAIVDGCVLPLTLSAPRGAEPESYVASPTTQYVDYARREVEIEFGHRRTVHWLSAPVIAAASFLCRVSQLDHAILVNNWLVSTNLYPTIDGPALRSLLARLFERWPDRAIVFRSVNDALTRDMLTVLEAAGGRAVFSRQVWLLDPSSDHGHRRSRSVARDRALARRSTSRWRKVEQFDGTDLDRLVALYRALYIDKYSPLNPRFTKRFVEHAVADRWLDVQVLERDGRVDAVVGSLVRGGVMTTPFIGYDTSRPQSDGLYRRISLQLLDEAIRLGCIQHLSSGVATFKRSRGARPAIEYHVVFDRHLPLRRRAGWMALGTVGRRVLVPAVRRYTL